ncbi:MAG TPA: HEAT repeat domain-containing protein [Sphingopyxis sp.]|nr:HEAT repeat domain-containing protein [Sphingopyxis sp.]
MTPHRSRHDHYPRTDSARVRSLREAATGLAGAWRDRDAALGGLTAALDAAAALTPDKAVGHLLPWLADTGWLHSRLREAAALLAADDFARPPLRIVGGGGGPGGLILAESGAVRLSLQLLPFEAPAASGTALFVPGRAAIRVLAAGGARIAFHHAPLSAAEEAGAFTAAGAAPCRSDPPRPLAAGELICLDTARTSFTIADASGDVLLLELAVQPPSPLPMRAYDIASGRLAHVSASRRDSSFRQMALALLRIFGRRDAAPLFAEAARTEDFAARWTAMRDLVALDATAAHPLLAQMAAHDPHPEVRRAAAATLALYSTPPLQRRGSETYALAR